MPPDDSTTSRSFSELLSDRTFGSFFYANSLSNVGNWFQNVAAGIVVYELTGSNTAVGVVSMVQFVATMLLTPWMGRLTDRVNRQRMLLTGQSIALAGAIGLAVTMFVVGLDGLPGPWPIYVATAVIGIGAAVILPSLQAIVPALVEPSSLDRAITLNSMTFNIARAVGPISAGAVVASFGAKWAFGINALTFVPLLVVLLLISPRGDVEPEDDAEGTVSEAVRWIKDRPAILSLMLGTLLVGWTSDPFSTLMPALADDFGGGEQTVGLLVGAFGGGAAIVAPFTEPIRGLVGKERAIPTGLGLMMTGLLIVAASPAVWVALIGSAITGSGFLLGVTGTNSLLQRAVPEELRGRVMAWWSVAFLGCRPLAAGFDGVVADLAGVRIAITVAAVVAASGAAALLLRAPQTANK